MLDNVRDWLGFIAILTYLVEFKKKNAHKLSKDYLKFERKKYNIYATREVRYCLFIKLMLQ